ncbi:MAG: Ldh family oxidoreductase, partial [Actinobacteria bacterium]
MTPAHPSSPRSRTPSPRRRSWRSRRRSRRSGAIAAASSNRCPSWAERGVDAGEGLSRLRALGFADADAQELWGHFDAAERRGKQGHGHARIPWLEGLEGYDPSAEPRLLDEKDGYQRWHGGGAIGYLVLGRVVRVQLEQPPAHARLLVCERTFPTGMLGHHVRRLADGGLVGVLTATSPRRLGHPAGGPKLAGTNPLAIGIPSSGGDPVVVDASMGAVTWGDVVAGLAQEEEL